MSSIRAYLKIYNKQFWLVCLSSLLFFSSFNMIIPDLPAYLTQLGGEEYKGLIIGLFTLTAMVSRPFSGKLADKVGRIPVMVFGTLVCVVIGVLYPLLATVGGFLWLRFFHGFSTGFVPTGKSAYLSDIVPAERRGEAMGLLGTAGAAGMAVGPVIGGILSNQYGFNILFYTSSFIALLSILILFGIHETLPAPERFSVSLLRIEASDWFDKLVWVPCVVMALAVFSYGVMLTVVPDIADYLGIGNSKGWLFACFTIASLLVRILAGRVSDLHGRAPVLMVSCLIIAIAMITIGFSVTPLLLFVGMSLYGFGHGMTAPTLLAWATDLSHPERKGRGLASLYIFMELGIGIGSIMAGFLYANDPDNFFVTFLTSAGICMLAFLFLVFRRFK